MENVVFRNKLFCKPCYLDTILNKCDKCVQVHISGISSSAISRSIICFSQSLVLASPSEESSGMTPVLHVISVTMYFKRENLETWEIRSFVTPALKLPHMEYELGIYLWFLYSIGKNKFNTICNIYITFYHSFMSGCSARIINLHSYSELYFLFVCHSLKYIKLLLLVELRWKSDPLKHVLHQSIYQSGHSQ